MRLHAEGTQALPKRQEEARLTLLQKLPPWLRPEARWRNLPRCLRQSIVPFWLHKRAQRVPQAKSKNAQCVVPKRLHEKRRLLRQTDLLKRDHQTVVLYVLQQHGALGVPRGYMIRIA